MEEKIDPYNHEWRFENWYRSVKRIGHIEVISKESSDVILKYVEYIKEGRNISNQSKSMKMDLIKTLISTDGAYYGLSLENLVLNN